MPAVIKSLIRKTPKKDSTAASSTLLRPSPIDANLIWAGTDDGLIHITRDGGKSWQNVTPPALTPWSKVSLHRCIPIRPADRIRRHQSFPAG